MTNSRILSVCFICFFIAACNTQEQSVTVETIPAIKKVPEQSAMQKTATVITRPALNLSIDDFTAEQESNDNAIVNKDKEPADETNALFKTLSKNQIQPKVNLSGKLLTDDDKLENKEYLDSVDGVQINIEGSFN
jgi:hypothetical protein